MCDCPTKPLLYIWGKTYMAKPKEHIEGHRYAKAKKFVPSYDKPCAPMANMYHLLGWQYQRQWRCELNQFLKQRSSKEQKHFIKPDVNYNKNRFAKMHKDQSKSKSKSKKGAEAAVPAG